MTTNPAAASAQFDGMKYLNLETYRKTEKAVRNPVWFAAAPAEPPGETAPKLYVYAVASSRNARRLRHTSAVKIAPCDVRDTVTGLWIDAHAQIVTGEEFARGMRLLNREYWPWKQLLGTLALFSRNERIVIAILLD